MRTAAPAHACAAEAARQASARPAARHAACHRRAQARTGRSTRENDGTRPRGTSAVVRGARGGEAAKVEEGPEIQARCKGLDPNCCSPRPRACATRLHSGGPARAARGGRAHRAPQPSVSAGEFDERARRATPPDGAVNPAHRKPVDSADSFRVHSQAFPGSGNASGGSNASNILAQHEPDPLNLPTRRAGGQTRSGIRHDDGPKTETVAGATGRGLKLG